jgi:hypothetical protein
VTFAILAALLLAGTPKQYCADGHGIHFCFSAAVKRLPAEKLYLSVVSTQEVRGQWAIVDCGDHSIQEVELDAQGRTTGDSYQWTTKPGSVADDALQLFCKAQGTK